MQDFPWITSGLLLADLCIRLGLSVRVIMRRRPVGVTLAWLAVVLGFPFFGAIVYLMFGELRLGNRRAQWAALLHEPYEEWLHGLRHRSVVDWTRKGPECQPLARLIESSVGIPALSGNALELIGNWEDVLDRLIQDIDAAKRTCHLEFYIWNPGGKADEVADALIRAAGRGVHCRVLLDDVGSKAFFKSDMPQRLRAGGVDLHAALPGGLFRMLFVRFDLRLHRKIVVIDGRLGYTGSLNLVDPRYFKQDSGVGQWVDAMARIEGPAVEPLGIIFLEDWMLETGHTLEHLRETGDVHPLRPRGKSAVQAVPSGPAFRSEAIERILLMAIYTARRELVLTTPYFVPDESLVAALIAAAQRGVDVTLIVPARVDSRLVRWASQAFKGDLLSAGVKVMLFDGGLLHTKSVTIDGEASLFGSLNLDPRSLHLNFEITLAIYDSDFTGRLRALQQSYLDDSEPMDYEIWAARSFGERFTENAARLLGPLL
jgi:cardiolipin synthase